jgi:membrane protein implicated in regulation of membrane protease activity
VPSVDPETWRWIWLVLAVAGIVGEIATAGTFFLFPFGLGAVIACILAFAGVDVVFQWIAFVLVSIGAFAASRPLVRRLDRSGPSGVGADRWVGKQGIVLRAIPNEHEAGLVRIGGEEWRAMSRSGVTVPAGSTVLVVEVVGTRLVVLPLELGQAEGEI